MSVLQNINGTLYRMDASDLVQLAAVDTEGILGGTPGATTNGQTLVDQLAADDVQAQSDIGQIKTDLSDYHVVPSKNLNTGKASITLTKPSARTSNEFPLVNIEAGKKYRIVLDTSAISGYTGSNAVGLRIEGGYLKSEDVYIPVNQGTGQWSYLFTIQESQTTTLAYTHIYAFIPSSEADGATITLSNIMVIAEDETDYTYEPYFLPMRDGKLDITDEQVLGAWNLARITLTSQTYQGVVWTVRDDMTILANGTTSADDRIYVGKVNLKAGRTYYLSGSPKAPTLYYWRLQLRKEISGVVYSIWDDGEGAEFSIPASQEGTWDIAIRYAPNISIPNIVFSPQVALKANTPYVPYAMTNRELTASITNKTTTTISQAFTDEAIYQNTGKTGDSKYLIRGGVCYLSLYVTAVAPVTTDTYVGVNLPVPASSGVFTFGSLCSSNGDVMMIAVRNRASDNLMMSGGVAGRKYYGSLAYPVA